MPHDTALLSTIAAGFAFAFAGGFVAVRVGLPPVVGYLLAGIAVGPFTPGFVADERLAPQLAEIGVILLMFGVGMHFSLRDLLQVRAIAVPGAVVQIVVATALGATLAHSWGWSLAAGLLLGLALSVASTVVLLRTLEAQQRLDTPEGRIAIGWLIVEDLVMVLVLVLVPTVSRMLDFGSPGSLDPDDLWSNLGITLGKVSLFVALMLLAGTRIFPWMLAKVERTGSRELFTLAVVALALGVGFGSAEVFGVSFALGAFFAGVVIHESDLSHRAAEELRPLQEIFAVLFFVSVGMLFDPAILVEEPTKVLGVVAIIVVGKSVAAFGIVRVLGHSAATALPVSAALAQIGEFSFILAALGVSLGLLPPAGQSLVVAGALLSITLSPAVYRLAARFAKLPA